jgi:hypothetical protein
MRNLISLLTVILIVASIAGCGSRTTDPGNSQLVEFSTSLKQLGMSGNITRVLLEVSGSGFSTISTDLSITQGVVHAEVEVPYGTGRIFALTAYAGTTALYHGTDTADVSTGSVTEVSIYMRPQVPMIRITPTYTKVVGVGQESTLQVEVFNVDSLFGLSFRLETDTSVIRFDGADAGTFLGGPETTLFFAFPYRNYLAAAYTMRGLDGQPDGMTGSGLVATVRFYAKVVGTAPVTFVPANLLLIDRHGQELPREGQVYMESGEVEIVGL